MISPVRAAATAVSGDTRYTLASAVPLRPSKLRLKVRRLTPPELGEKPIPIQGPQAHSSSRAPETRISDSAPQSASMVRTCREPGDTDILTEGDDGPALQHSGGFQQIVQRGIGAGADADLIHLDALQTADGHHLVRHVGAGDQRLQRVQINVDNPVIGRVRDQRKGV